MSFEKFIKINKKIIFKKKTKKYCLIIDRGRAVNTFYQSIYAAVINKKFNFDTKVLLSSPPRMKSLFQSFGDIDFYNSHPFGSTKNIFYLIKGLFFVLKNYPKLKKMNLDSFVKNFKICGINIGDLIYDTYIRYEHRYISPKIDSNFLIILISTFAKVHLINDLITKHNIKYILIGQTDKATIGAIARKLGIKNNIKTLEPSNDFSNRFYFIKHNKDKINYGPYNFYYRYLANDQKLLERTKINQKQFNIFFYKRCFGKIKMGYSGETDLLNANQNLKLVLNRKDLIKKLNLNFKKVDKIILVALHAFSDAPHGDGSDILFNDYYAHAKETLEFLNKQKNKRVVYLIKPHPSRFLYNEHNLFENLFEEVVHKNENIKICPVSITTHNLISLCDAAVTLRGTIAIEFVSNGKPALTCSTTPFSKLNIINEAKTKKEYFNKILKLTNNKNKLPRQKIIKAQKVLYLMELHFPENFLGESKIFNKKFLLSNRRTKSFETYFSVNFLNKIKKRGFLNDKYIKQLKKII